MSSPEDNLVMLLHEKHTSSYAKSCMRPSSCGYIWCKGTMRHVMSITKHRRCSEVVLIAKKGYILCQRRTCPKSCGKKIAQNSGACAAPTPSQCNIPTLWYWALGGGACLSIMDHFGLPTVLSLLVKLNYCFLVLNQHAVWYYSDCHTGTGLLLQMTNIETHVQETHIQLLRI